jgi:hypothetical protein
METALLLQQKHMASTWDCEDEFKSGKEEKV